MSTSEARFAWVAVALVLLWGLAGYVAGPESFDSDPPTVHSSPLVLASDAQTSPPGEVTLTCRPSTSPLTRLPRHAHRGSGFYINHLVDGQDQQYEGGNDLSLICRLKNSQGE